MNVKPIKSKESKASNKRFVISLGGSLIAPDHVDHDFIRRFRKLILSHPDSIFYIVCGGGMTARDYVSSAEKISDISTEDKDWIGIQATFLNAYLLKTVFGDSCHDKIITDPSKKIISKKRIILASGWKPGFSTDFDSVMIAKVHGIGTVINLSDIDYIYDKDPKKFDSVHPIKNITWGDYKKLIGDKWSASMHAPFDPIASAEAEKMGLKVIILNGKNISNINNLLDGKKFDGTVIN